MLSRFCCLVVMLGVVGVTAALDAQTFQRTLGGAFDDRPNCVEKTTDGGSIICGDQSVLVFV